MKCNDRRNDPARVSPFHFGRLAGGCLLIGCGLLPAAQGAQPIIDHLYTADCSAHVFNDTIYLYPSHDPDVAVGFFPMVDYHVFSSKDLQTWTDHGEALHLKDVPWATDRMWAPDAACKNGVYYFYFPARNQQSEFQIGVATSKKPEGPFIAQPRPIEGSRSIDPAVFADQDDSFYMYFGGLGQGGLTNGPYVAKMADDMLGYAEKPRLVNVLDENGQPLTPADKERYFFEACWMHTYNGTYYLSYSTGHTHNIVYATADNPYGPFTYRGRLISEVLGWTTHHSIVEYNDKWYLFYHDSTRSGGKTNQRCVKMTELFYDENGLMSAPGADVLHKTAE